MKLFILFVIVSGIFLFSCEKNPTETKNNDTVEPDIIQSIIDDTNLDTLKKFVNVLSGEIPVNINGTIQTIQSRHKNYPGNEVAATYIYNKLLSYGYIAYNQVFS